MRPALRRAGRPPHTRPTASAPPRASSIRFPRASRAVQQLLPATKIPAVRGADELDAQRALDLRVNSARQFQPEQQPAAPLPLDQGRLKPVQHFLPLQGGQRFGCRARQGKSSTATVASSPRRWIRLGTPAILNRAISIAGGISSSTSATDEYLAQRSSRTFSATSSAASPVQRACRERKDPFAPALHNLFPVHPSTPEAPSNFDAGGAAHRAAATRTEAPAAWRGFLDNILREPSKKKERPGSGPGPSF